MLVQFATRRRKILFWVSILIPASVLVILGWTMYHQQVTIVEHQLNSRVADPAEAEAVVRDTRFRFWFLTCAVVLALSVLLIVSHLRRGYARGNAIDWTKLGRALSTWFALAVSVALFKPLGFVISFALLTYFIVAVMYRRPLKTAALVAVASAAGFYLVFDRALGVPLPVGILGF